MSGKSWIRVAIAVFALVALVGLASRAIYVQWKSQLVLQTLLAGDSGDRLEDTASTRYYVLHVLPELVSRHEEAAENYTAKMYRDGYLNAYFNRRVASWRGLVEGFNLTADADTRDYIRRHLNSENLLDEEVDTVRQSLGVEWRLKLQLQN